MAGSAGLQTPDVLIVGGGIAGLAAALRIRALDSVCTIVVAEATARLGGRIAGEIVEGCVVDGGPDVCIGDKLRTTHLFDHLALSSRVLRVNPRELPTLERRDGMLQRYASNFTGELLTFPGGLQELVDVTAAAMQDVAVVPETPIHRLDQADGRWVARSARRGSFAARTVVLAAPAPVASALLASVATDESVALGSLQQPATTTVTMAWRARDLPRPLDATGYLVADSDSRLTACTWTSSKNPTHASADMVLLRGYIRGGAAGAAELMCREVATVLGITASPSFTRVYEWLDGIPVYTPQHRTAVQNLEQRLAAEPGLFVAGSAFHGIGVPDCIHSGERAAAAVVSYLEATRAEEAA